MASITSELVLRLPKAFGGAACNPNDCANVVGVTFATSTGTETVCGTGIALAAVQAIAVNGLIASRAQTNATGDDTLGGL
ncbi:hypothetical protein C7S18_07435 [Ahniella affigens]|uniref:Uncharacterized protein n=1 Tax=Ahniella affigens TaxID=2021234 RepID=A0A2P1PQC2_9GAMM|nr:hypothetical protein [Ahniella affigens]AVP97034.1 hypothetical protein C7S18_07435 [Ahniella affigens]